MKKVMIILLFISLAFNSFAAKPITLKFKTDSVKIEGKSIVFQRIESSSVSDAMQSKLVGAPEAVMQITILENNLNDNRAMLKTGLNNKSFGNLKLKSIDTTLFCRIGKLFPKNDFELYKNESQFYVTALASRISKEESKKAGVGADPIERYNYYIKGFRYKDAYDVNPNGVAALIGYGYLQMCDACKYRNTTRNDLINAGSAMLDKAEKLDINSVNSIKWVRLKGYYANIYSSGFFDFYTKEEAQQIFDVAFQLIEDLKKIPDLKVLPYYDEGFLNITSKINKEYDRFRFDIKY